ncbi:hypothetical protein KIMH_02130 [Bombiscardovia apis]|uniref:Uncharacterized protein n=1 Tax=Bombiscardovia apis TaxID=2932182 RepID=A0ABM8BB14_9BIFI|nr:hypothetical protein [Bombiscardovia apis]BDR54102.1 hypothetical protein KIMH_02130 [Bombiscardovia apis]
MFNVLLAGLLSISLASPAGMYDGDASNAMLDTQPQVTMAKSEATCDRE